jgi:hypothetical protein
VLLLGPLAVAYKNLFPQSNTMKVIKNGSKVKRIIFSKDHIYIGDIREMLSPSASLAKFAKCTGLKEEKLCFPFSAFTSLAFLDRPK